LIDLSNAMNLKPLEEYVCREAVGMNVTPRQARALLALRPAKRPDGTAYWQIRTTASMVAELREEPKPLQHVMRALEGKRLVASGEKEPTTAHLLWRLTKLGQQVVLEAAAERKLDAEVSV